MPAFRLRLGHRIAAVHGIEALLQGIDDQCLRADMLTLRRHEKDFMLRRDARYGDQFKAAAAQFAATLAHADAPAAVEEEVSQKLASYQRDFLAWTETAQAFASSQKAASEAFSAIEPQIDALNRGVTRIRSDAAGASDAVRAATRLQIEKIARNVQHAAAGTTRAADVNRGAAETGAASTHVLASARSLSSDSNHLKVEVDRFVASIKA